MKVEGADAMRESLKLVIPKATKELLRIAAQAAFDSAQEGADAHTRAAGDGDDPDSEDTNATSGALARSLKMREEGGGWEIFHDLQVAPHAVFVHWGTKEHPIEPKNKKALRWVSGGVFVFAKLVKNHPGYEGDPWLIQAKKDAMKAVEKRLNR